MATRTKSRRPARSTATRTKPRTAARSTARTKSRSAAATTHRRREVARRQPETLRVRSFSPSYTVNDLQASIAWYCDGLGFVVRHRWEDKGQLRGVTLAAGTCEIGLSQDDFSKGRDRVMGVGYRLYASTAQSIDSLADRIRSYGGKITMEPSDQWGTRSFAVEDPDGYKITFKQTK